MRNEERTARTPSPIDRVERDFVPAGGAIRQRQVVHRGKPSALEWPVFEAYLWKNMTNKTEYTEVPRCWKSISEDFFENLRTHSTMFGCGGMGPRKARTNVASKLGVTSVDANVSNTYRFRKRSPRT
ncbi:MAG TPA: hypothetical protein DD670_05640 [Planctomycetaceae bacterium]|nr:hypothetical protein [Planctomycetaceae bacterium]